MPILTPNSTITLNSGYKMPILGFGLWQTPARIATEVSIQALEVGYRHFDSANLYGNEAAVGRAIKAVRSFIPREEIFFTSKVPTDKMSYEAASDLVDETLRKTGLSYIDLFLIHAPYGGSEARKEVWRALVEAVEAGKVRSIGVSNYGVHHLKELERHIAELEYERGGRGRGGVISVGQWELHPWLARHDIVRWCRARHIAVEAYSPLVRGKRWGNPGLEWLAEKYGVSQAQVLLRWSLQKGFIPLPKSIKLDRMQENFDVFDFSLTQSEVARLETKEYSSVVWDPTKEPLDE